MPDENELKYVTTGYDELETLLTPHGWEDIEQGYLNPSNRIRRITYENGKHHHLFGYKGRMPNGHNREIELPIESGFFHEVWEDTVERLRKRRISIEQRGLKWDIDFYRWPSGSKYFVLAEVEMPASMSEPEVILPYLQKHLVYQVPRSDGRFAARRLANEDHARAMAIELGIAQGQITP